MENPTIVDLISNLLTDLQTGFFFYTLVYFGLRLSKGKEKLREFDKSAAMVICCVSVLFLFVWVADVIYGWNISEENKHRMQNRMAGPYAWSYWLPPFLYFILPQLLWSRKVRENWFTRFFVAFFLFFNFEKYVIIITSLHRDYLPSSWAMYDGSLPFEIAFGIAWKFVLFTGLAALLFSISAKKDTFAS